MAARAFAQCGMAKGVALQMADVLVMVNVLFILFHLSFWV